MAQLVTSNRFLPSILIPLALIGLSGCASSPAPVPLARKVTEPLALGQPLVAADIAMKNVDGKTVTLAGLAGEAGTLVVFTCNHCPWAKAWEGRIAEIGGRYAKQGFGVVAINPNDPAAYPEDGFEEMQERAQALGLTFPYVVDADGAVAKAFGASKTPEIFLFDRERKLAFYGAVDDNARDEAAVEERYLEDALSDVLAGRAVRKPWTKALGCSIKVRP